MRIKLLLITLLFALTFMTAKAEVIEIESECIKVSDIYPTFGIKDDIFCGMDYGEYRKISVQHTAFIIRKYKLNGARPGEAVFRRKGVKISFEALSKKVAEELKYLYPNTKTKVENIKLNKELYAASEDAVKIELPRGRFGTVIAKIDNGSSKTSVPMYISAFQEGYITMAQIDKGSPVNNSVRKELIDITKVRGELVTETDKVIAARNIGAGKVLTANFIEMKPEMTSGSVVRILYKSDSINLATKGTLEEDAFKGKIVRVKNLASGKIITAKYIGGNTTISNFN